MGVVSTFWLLWIMLLWAFAQKLRDGHVFISLRCIPMNEFIGYKGTLFNILRPCLQKQVYLPPTMWEGPKFFTFSPTHALFFSIYFPFKIIYFVLGYSWLTNNIVIVSGEQWRNSHTNTGTSSPPKSPPIQAITWHWAEFHVLYGSCLLVIHFKYSWMYVSIPNSLPIPSPQPCPQKPKACESVSVLYISSLVSFLFR